MSMAIKVVAWSHDWFTSRTLALAASGTLTEDVEVRASAKTLDVST